MEHDPPDSSTAKLSETPNIPPAPPDQVPVYPPPVYPPAVYTVEDGALPESSFAGYSFAPPVAPSVPRVRPAWRVLAGAFLLGGLIFSVLAGGLVLLLLSPARTASPSPRTATPQHTPLTLHVSELAAPAAIATATALAHTATQVYGPQDGILQLRGTNLIANDSADLDVQDFVAEATFNNPYAADTHAWDYGFFFRSTGDNRSYRLYVESDGSWVLELVDTPTDESAPDAPTDEAGAATPTALPNSLFTTTGEGTVATLNTGATGTNRLRLAVQGARGLFFVNDRYVATLNVSAKTSAGNIEIGAAFLTDDDYPGHSVRYTGFSVWSLDP